MIGTGTMTTATHANTVVPIFVGRLCIEAVSMSVLVNQAMGANLEPLGVVALIGRDLLAECVFVYNGLDGSFSLSV